MLHFCTYFDRNYLAQGLTLYRSLMEHAGPFTLWVLCFDDTARDVLSRLNLANLRPVSLQEFEKEPKPGGVLFYVPPVLAPLSIEPPSGNRADHLSRRRPDVLFHAVTRFRGAWRPVHPDRRPPVPGKVTPPGGGVRDLQCRSPDFRE